VHTGNHVTAFGTTGPDDVEALIDIDPACGMDISGFEQRVVNPCKNAFSFSKRSHTNSRPSQQTVNTEYSFFSLLLSCFEPGLKAEVSHCSKFD